MFLLRPLTWCYSCSHICIHNKLKNNNNNRLWVLCTYPEFDILMNFIFVDTEISLSVYNFNWDCIWLHCILQKRTYYVWLSCLQLSNFIALTIYKYNVRSEIWYQHKFVCIQLNSKLKHLLFEFSESCMKYTDTFCWLSLSPLKDIVLVYLV